MGKREERQEAIRTIVRGSKVRTQRDLAERLKEFEHDCTQATVSRDIAEMGLQKTPEGFYALPEDLSLSRAIGDMAVSIEDAENLVVIKTRPGAAAMLGEAIDNAGVEGLLGSVAGDNTILMVAKTREYAIKMVTNLENMRK